MSRYSLLHLSDATLRQALAAVIVRDRISTADVLAHIAEFDARRLFVPAAYPSMFAFCLGELRLSEDAAYKRIQAARAARRFPKIFAAVAEGRLHLSAVVLLAAQLTEANADELLAAATHKSKSEIERLLAERFPRPDLPARIRAIPTGSEPAMNMEPAQARVEPERQLAPGQVGGSEPVVPGAVEAPVSQAPELAPGQVGTGLQSPAGTLPAASRPRLTPLAPERYGLQLTIDRSTHDKLRRAQDLLSHSISPGDIAGVLDRALDVLIAQLEKRKFAASSKSRTGRDSGHPARNPRHIPAHVKRAVFARDRGRCTFVSASGRRCESRERLEFDHMIEVARGGDSTVANLRLRCRAHNQFTAECTFGAGFMDEKRREAAVERAAEARAAIKERADPGTCTATPNSRSA